MSLVPKEILLSHLQRAEGAEEVTLPIDFFRDLLYQAMPRTWVFLDDETFAEACQIAERGNYLVAFQRIQSKLKELNT
jgi:hypothetical protein